ncbi:hypothetical protein HYV86_01055 [Candidatus Woesearchaeota archaeon]|nr:hypothetical protein [Candidatus Woesearchaeota archaeon]
MAQLLSFKVITLLCLLFLLIGCSSKPTTLSCQSGYHLEGKSCVPSSTCGDFTCDPSEICDLDCPSQCTSSWCTSKVNIICTQPDCGPQEKLFDDYAQLQTKVIECLETYFQFELPTITYTFNGGTSSQSCTQPEGCCCTEGGLTGGTRVNHGSLNGFKQKGTTQPTQPNQLLADEHETTHAFLNAMIHQHPSWFSEAIAIQTNERVSCDTTALTPNTPTYNYSLQGDAHLRETQVDARGGGVILHDGKPLNEEWYQRLKTGQIQLTQREQDSHVLGALWIIGLKQDYNCKEQCITKIVQTLHQQEKQRCQQGLCSVPHTITTTEIFDTTNNITQKDTRPLFKLLNLI